MYSIKPMRPREERSLVVMVEKSASRKERWLLWGTITARKFKYISLFLLQASLKNRFYIHYMWILRLKRKEIIWPLLESALKSMTVWCQIFFPYTVFFSINYFKYWLSHWLKIRKFGDFFQKRYRGHLIQNFHLINFFTKITLVLAMILNYILQLLCCSSHKYDILINHTESFSVSKKGNKPIYVRNIFWSVQMLVFFSTMILKANFYLKVLCTQVVSQPFSFVQWIFVFRTVMATALLS